MEKHANLRAYKGELPYIFVSYAHADSEKVYPLLMVLQNAGYRIWFDRGIEAGTEWSNNIAEHLSQCEAFVFFLSEKSAQSENCLDEVAFAKSHNKPALMVCLEEDVKLPAGAEMQTARFQRLFLTRQNGQTGFLENFTAATIFDPCRDVAMLIPVTTEACKPVKAKPAAKKGVIGAIVACVVLIALIVSIAFGFGGQDGSTNQEQSQTEPQQKSGRLGFDPAVHFGGYDSEEQSVSLEIVRYQDDIVAIQYTEENPKNPEEEFTFLEACVFTDNIVNGEVTTNYIDLVGSTGTLTAVFREDHVDITVSVEEREPDAVFYFTEGTKTFYPKVGFDPNVHCASYIGDGDNNSTCEMDIFMHSEDYISLWYSETGDDESVYFNMVLPVSDIENGKLTTLFSDNYQNTGTMTFVFKSDGYVTVMAEVKDRNYSSFCFSVGPVIMQQMGDI